ncbi:hypothetical protein [[Enterobacter] lignolyticus]|nr:hypothetical protein [[Enterobacter] lignolyticus]
MALVTALNGALTLVRTGGWDPKFNADLRQFTEVKGEYGLSKEMIPSKLPSSFGDISSSFSSEYGGKKFEPFIEDKLK